MAATPVSRLAKNTPDSLAFEIFTVTNGGADTTFTITPTSIKSIWFAQAFAMAATGSAADAYLASFKPGDATCVMTGVNSGEYLVMVWGTIA